MSKPKGRISGRALRALVTAARHTPARHVVARMLRNDLGVDRARALGESCRVPLPFSAAPIRARQDHARPSLELPAPEPDSWPVSAARLSDAYAKGEVSPTEVVTRALATARELAARTPTLGPLLDFDDDRALAAAAQSTERITRGEPRSALEGIPIAIKEEVCVQGLPVRVGTGWIEPTPAAADAVAVARLRAAGAIIVGTTPMTEYGMSPLGGNVHRAMPRNAHDPSRLPGGSSSGSAVAVATGVCPVALGADGGGSVRIPASLNGVFGLKPTFGRIPLSGHGLSGGTTVVHLGPIGASPRELATFIEIAGGPEPSDPASHEAEPIAGGTLIDALGRGVRGLRIGIDEAEWQDASPEIAAAGKQALQALEREGATLCSVTIPMADVAAAIGYLTIGIEVLATLGKDLAPHMSELGLDLQLLLAVLDTFRPDDYVDAQRLRGHLRHAVASLLAGVDVIALPTTAQVAPAITDAEAQSGFIDPAALGAMCRFAFLGNLTGLPAGTAPVGADSKNLPIGLQIIGDAWDEACVLQVLAHLERAGAATVRKPQSAVALI